MKQINAKTTTHSNKAKNVKTIVQNPTCQLHRLWNSEEFMWIRGCSLLMGAHVCFSFFSAATHLAYSVGFHAQKEKSKYFFGEVRARFLGIKWLPPRRANPTKKTSVLLIWLVVLSHALLFGCKTCALVTRWKSLSSWSAWTRWLFVFFKINLGLEKPKSLANPGFEGHFLKSTWTLANNRFINKNCQDWKVFHL